MTELRFRNRRVLVLTNTADSTADAVEAELGDRGVSFTRFDLADFPSRSSMTWTSRVGHGVFRVGDHEVDLSSVTAVYHRRPGPVMPDPSLDARAYSFARAEAHAGLLGVLLTLECHWVNHPASEILASYKPLQLAEARRSGLAVPATIVTNDPSSVKEFFDRAAGPVAYKGLGRDFLPVEHNDLGVPTRLVTREDIDDSVAVSATMFPGVCGQKL